MRKDGQVKSVIQQSPTFIECKTIQIHNLTMDNVSYKVFSNKHPS